MQRKTCNLLLLATAVTMTGCATSEPSRHGFHAAFQSVAPFQAGQLDVWVLGVTVSHSGEAAVDLFRPGSWPSFQIAPCASTSDVMDAHQATLSRTPPRRAPFVTAERDFVLTTLDQNGVELCSQIYPVIVDEAIEGPPSAPGKTDWVWRWRRPDPFHFTAAIPRDRTAAIRLSGWKGTKTTIVAISDLKRRFVAGE